jgi:hypothetical protein
MEQSSHDLLNMGLLLEHNKNRTNCDLVASNDSNFLQLLGFYIKLFMSLVLLYSAALVTLCYWFT